MPPSAASIRPTLRWCAPVKAPFSWPNSSDWIRCSGIAPQLIATNGLSARRDCRCRVRATSSLPVPLSPRISTGESVGASFASSRRRSRTARLSPSSSCSPSASPGTVPRPRRRAMPKARPRVTCTRAMSNGKVWKSKNHSQTKSPTPFTGKVSGLSTAIHSVPLRLIRSFTVSGRSRWNGRRRSRPTSQARSRAVSSAQLSTAQPASRRPGNRRRQSSHGSTTSRRRRFDASGMCAPLRRQFFEPS
ncbi:Uncharacterised protein [Pseudomonas aeruginosa]|nr:Uncharacterised protein [Pseudomonas aeruginosa]